MRDIVVRFDISLHEAWVEMQPLLVEYLQTLSPEGMVRLGEVRQYVTACDLKPLDRSGARKYQTVPYQLFVAWVIHFLRRQCFVELAPYREAGWFDLLQQDADLFNALREISSRTLSGLYWLCSPRNTRIAEHIPVMILSHARLTVTTFMSVPVEHRIISAPYMKHLKP